MKGIVWYKNDRNMAINFMYEIMDNYKRIHIPIKALRNSKTNFCVNFTNGDEWRISKLVESSRGYKCNLSYYPAFEKLSTEDFNLIRFSAAPPFYAATSYWPSIQQNLLEEEENIELPFN